MPGNPASRLSARKRRLVIAYALSIVLNGVFWLACGHGLRLLSPQSSPDSARRDLPRPLQVGFYTPKPPAPLNPAAPPPVQVADANSGSPSTDQEGGASAGTAAQQSAASAAGSGGNGASSTTRQSGLGTAPGAQTSSAPSQGGTDAKSGAVPNAPGQARPARKLSDSQKQALTARKPTPGTPQNEKQLASPKEKQPAQQAFADNEADTGDEETTADGGPIEKKPPVKPNATMLLKLIKTWTPRPDQKFELPPNLNIQLPDNIQIEPGPPLTPEQIEQIRKILSSQKMRHLGLDRKQLMRLLNAARQARARKPDEEKKDKKKDAQEAKKPAPPRPPAKHTPRVALVTPGRPQSPFTYRQWNPEMAARWQPDAQGDQPADASAASPPSNGTANALTRASGARHAVGQGQGAANTRIARGAGAVATPGTGGTAHGGASQGANGSAGTSGSGNPSGLGNRGTNVSHASPETSGNGGQRGQGTVAGGNTTKGGALGGRAGGGNPQGRGVGGQPGGSQRQGVSQNAEQGTGSAGNGQQNAAGGNSQQSGSRGNNGVAGAGGQQGNNQGVVGGTGANQGALGQSGRQGGNQGAGGRQGSVAGGGRGQQGVAGQQGGAQGGQQGDGQGVIGGGSGQQGNGSHNGGQQGGSQGNGQGMVAGGGGSQGGNGQQGGMMGGGGGQRSGGRGMVGGGGQGQQGQGSQGQGQGGQGQGQGGQGQGQDGQGQGQGGQGAMAGTGSGQGQGNEAGEGQGDGMLSGESADGMQSDGDAGQGNSEQTGYVAAVGGPPDPPEHDPDGQKGLPGALVLPPSPPVGTDTGTLPDPRPVKKSQIQRPVGNPAVAARPDGKAMPAQQAAKTPTGIKTAKPSKPIPPVLTIGSTSTRGKFALTVLDRPHLSPGTVTDLVDPPVPPAKGDRKSLLLKPKRATSRGMSAAHGVKPVFGNRQNAVPVREAKNSQGVKEGSETPLPATLLPSKDAEVGDGSGLKGEYYLGRNFDTYLLIRADPNIEYDWRWDSSPDARIMPGTDWSIRWTGKIAAPTTETYTFYASADDGVRVWINHRIIIDDWTLHAALEYSNQVQMQAGKQYDLKVEYFESGGPPASVALYWESNSTKRQFIPESAYFYPLPGDEDDRKRDEAPAQ